jgi:hypothetical protein
LQSKKLGITAFVNHWSLQAITMMFVLLNTGVQVNFQLDIYFSIQILAATTNNDSSEKSKLLDVRLSQSFIFSSFKLNFLHVFV